MLWRLSAVNTEVTDALALEHSRRALIRPALTGTRYVLTGEARLVDLTSETRPADYGLTGRLRCGPD
jgi:hypothetical protein